MEIIKATEEVEPYFGRKFFVNLIIKGPEKLLVGKHKTTVFLSWPEKR